MYYVLEMLNLILEISHQPSLGINISTKRLLRKYGGGYAIYLSDSKFGNVTDVFVGTIKLHCSDKTLRVKRNELLQ